MIHQSPNRRALTKHSLLHVRCIFIFVATRIKEAAEANDPDMATGNKLESLRGNKYTMRHWALILLSQYHMRVATQAETVCLRHHIHINVYA